MMFSYQAGVTIVDSGTQANINWVSDLVVKCLCGACTVLLSIAVSSLQSMNGEIKQLSQSISDLSVSSSIIIESQKRAETRLDKLEAADELTKNKLRDVIIKVELLEKTRH